MMRVARIAFCLLALLASSSSFAPVRADVDFPTVGDRGDRHDRDRCPGGQYLVGLSVRFGSWVDNVTLKCASLRADGTVQTLTTLATRGGNGGGPFIGPSQCAAGSLVNGLRYTFTNDNRQVRKFVLECRPYKGGDPSEIPVGVVADTQSPHDHICPLHQVAVGMNINSGKHVNAVGIICDAEPLRTIPSPVEARKFKKCDDYARSAVNQYLEYAGRNCGATDKPPGRWSNNYPGHYAWCFSMTEGNGLPDHEKQERAGPLSQCRTINAWGAAAKASLPACNASVVVRNKACKNLDGSPSSILAPGTLSAVGCGTNDAQALSNAKASFGSQAAISDQPANGACTYDAQHFGQCLCR